MTPSEGVPKSVFTFLSKLNHDLRTPLTAMLNMIGLIKENPQLYCTPENIQLIQETGEELKTMLQGVSDLAKLESGTLTLKMNPGSVRGLLERTVSRFEQEARQKNVQLRLDVEDRVPDWIMMDKERLGQIFSQLISNAVKNTHQGTVTIRVASSTPQGDRPGELLLVFAVEDTGSGIPENLQEHLFDRFLQPEGDGLLKTAGSGLGLALSKRLAHLMGGRLNMYSVVGKGSTFTFDLPIREPGQSPSSPLRDQTGAGLAALGPLRVLVVEDNFINLLSFGQMLERYGFETQSASNGKQALDFILKNSFDIVLMDVKMPVMDGLEATRRIRTSQDPRVRDTKVVALTAYAMPEDRKRILQAGMDDIVTKPIEIEELSEVLRRVLEK